MKQKLKEKMILHKRFMLWGNLYSIIKLKWEIREDDRRENESRRGTLQATENKVWVNIYYLILSKKLDWDLESISY